MQRVLTIATDSPSARSGLPSLRKPSFGGSRSTRAFPRRSSASHSAATRACPEEPFRRPSLRASPGVPSLHYFSAGLNLPPSPEAPSSPRRCCSQRQRLCTPHHVSCIASRHLFSLLSIFALSFSSQWLCCARRPRTRDHPGVLHELHHGGRALLAPHAPVD